MLQWLPLKNLLLFNLILLLNSCGYRWQPNYPNDVRPTVSVPFVIGDDDGMLTAEIIAAISASGVADVKSYGGDYSLIVAIVNEASEKIGFRIDPQKVDKKVRKNLLACEERRTMILEAKLCLSGEIAYGPYRISADADYDYVDGDSVQDLTFTEPTGTTMTVLPFSLGQLEPAESAALASTKPLYRRLAQKVVDAISSDW